MTVYDPPAEMPRSTSRDQAWDTIRQFAPLERWSQLRDLRDEAERLAILTDELGCPLRACNAMFGKRSP